ncbi:MAG: ABC transporter permease [Cyanobacteria bacterium P01_E01_bin.48]
MTQDAVERAFTIPETRGGLRPTVFWRISEAIPRSLSALLMFLSVAVPLCLWWAISNGQVNGEALVNAKFLPSPQNVIAAFEHLWSEGFLIKDTFASFFRVVTGFLLAAILSVPLGIAMGSFASVRALLEPAIGIIRYMPAPAFTPLLIIYLGLDEPPKIALIFIGTIFFNTLMIMDAVKFVPKELLEATYTLGGTRPQVLFQVITPYVVPNILDAFRINMAASWNLVVVAELLAADEGLGKRIQLAQRFFKTDEIFACLIVLGLIGFAIDLSMRVLQRVTCKWAID